MRQEVEEAVSRLVEQEPEQLDTGIHTVGDYAQSKGIPLQDEYGDTEANRAILNSPLGDTFGQNCVRVIDAAAAYQVAMSDLDLADDIVTSVWEQITLWAPSRWKTGEDGTEYEEW